MRLARRVYTSSCEQIEAAGMPDEARKQAERELERLGQTPPAAAEHGVIRTYLEWMVELPWSKASEDRLDVPEAAECVWGMRCALCRVYVFVSRIDHRYAVRRLESYVDDELDGDDVDRVTSHVVLCDDCSADVRFLLRVRASLRARYRTVCT